MRWKAALLVGLLLVSGCISGGSGTDAGNESQGQAIDAKSAANSSAQNASSNATYLKNSDYNQTHVHDYWPGNATTKILMDETVDVYSWIQGDGAMGGAWFSLPNGSFVPQGTGLLTVEVDATGALENGQQVLEYKAADSGRYKALDGQGAKATWEIEVSPEMTDLPHSKSTRWSFILRADGTGSIMSGEVNVKITAEKLRDLEAWPEHPDFWDGGNKTRLGLGNYNATFDELETYAERFTQRGPDDEPVNLSEGTLVPPETEVLLVKFWYERDDDPKNCANADINLRVKEGAYSTWYGWQEHRIVREKAGYKMYAIPVDGSNWDSPYAEQSAWSFLIEEPMGVCNPATGDRYYMNFGEVGAGNATIDATAFRVTPPWLESLMQEEGIGDGRSASDR